MNWKEECRRVHLEGMNALAREGSMPFRFRVYNADGVAADPDLVVPEGVDGKVYDFLRTKVFLLFQHFQAPAALMQMDTWQVNGNKFAVHFGLSMPCDSAEYKKEYSRILNEKFKGTAANLPPELITEGMITTIKGPKIMPVSFITQYSRKEDDTLEFRDIKELEKDLNPLLPDWWETVIN
jgi:hypothetical protein